MILRQQLCQGEHTVSDDAFGFWHESWGEPPVHTFPCGELAVTTVTDPHDGTVLALCAACSGQRPCDIEFGDHQHDDAECERLLDAMSGAEIRDYLAWEREGYSREAEAQMLGRPLFPNEY